MPGPEVIMATQEIPRSEWRSFCETFTRQHEGWVATVEVLTGELGDQIEANDMPFQAINADLKGSDPDAIEITLGSPNKEVTRTAQRVTKLSFEQSESGEHEGLEIQTVDGETTVMRFRVAQYPEALDQTAEDKIRKAGG
jgi:hypothetical protein